jgi:hypothetical protein
MLDIRIRILLIRPHIGLIMPLPYLDVLITRRYMCLSRWSEVIHTSFISRRSWGRPVGTCTCRRCKTFHQSPLSAKRPVRMLMKSESG